MVYLSVEHINRIAPYKVTEGSKGFVDFKTKNTAMLYICDTGDGKQAMRNRLFKYWITESEYYDKVNTVSGCVTDEEGIKNFASLVIRFDHPKMEDVVMEFLNTIKLLNDKPRL